MSTLVVCSWNIHECVGADGRHDPARVARVLGEIAADVVALQEVHSDESRGGEWDQARYLARALSVEAIAGPTLERRGGRYGNLVLTRLPVHSVYKHDLGLPGREPRGALEVALDLEGVRLRVMATHLGLRATERSAQARRLMDRLGPRREGETVLLLGDFNEWRPWGTVLRLLSRRFGPTPAPRTFPARRPLLALDRIWVDPATQIEAIEAHRSPRARRASDHLPVVARVSVTPLPDR